MSRESYEIGYGWLRSLVVAFVIQVSLNVAVLLALGIGVTAAYRKAEAAEDRVSAIETELKSWVLIDARKHVDKMIEVELQRRQNANTIEPPGENFGPARRQQSGD